MYDDFEITISAEEPSGGSNVTVRSSRGMRMGTFSLSNVADAVANLHALLHQPQPDPTVLQQAGTALFDELFKGNILTAWRETWTLARSQQREVRLRIYSELPSLITIPWEYLYDDEQIGWFVLHPELSLVRALPLATGNPLPVPESLRVLVMIANPSDWPTLDVAREWSQLESIADQANIELLRVEPNYAALLGALRQQPHVFHFIGHGQFDEQTKQGVLYLCKEDGNGLALPAEKFANLLGGHSTLRLVLLNACQGATVDSTSAFAGIAQCLIKREIPAVIAMQAPVVDEHAVRFSQEFYRALADGLNVEAALGQGRKRINEVAATWGIPTLYLQGSEPFAIKLLSNVEKAERLWQRSQRIADRVHRREVIAQILQLDPNHAGANAAQKRFDNEDQAEQLYATAEAYVQNQQWREAHRLLTQIEQLSPNFRQTRSLLAEALGKLGGGVPVKPVDDATQQEEYRPILNALLEGRLVPFLGWEVGHFGRPAGDSWVAGHSLPDANEAARVLAKQLEGTVEGNPSLPQASQYTSLLEGESALYDRLSSLYQGDYSPTLLHRLLAELPRRLGKQRRADRRYVIFTIAFDDLLERAFAEAEQAYHLFAYRHRFFDENGVVQPGRFIHIAPAGETVEVISPNDYRDHDSDRHPVIIKLCGRHISAEPDSVIVTEDQYLDYLPAQEVGALLPATLLREINKRSFLFFGFSLQPWHLRLLWHRMRYMKRRLHDRSWAIVPELSKIEEEFWRSQDIVPIVTAPEVVVAFINRWLDNLEAKA